MQSEIIPSQQAEQMIIKRGRPLVKKQNSVIIYEFNNFISSDSDCTKLFKLIANQASYDIRIITRNKKNMVQDQQNLQTIQKICNQNKKFCPKVFFLSNQQKIYSYENQNLVDLTNYTSIIASEFDPKFQILITKLNKVLRELDQQFIKIICDILIQYTYWFDENLDQNQIVQKIIEEIQNPNNFNKYQYLFLWQQMKNITKEVRKDMKQKNLQNLQTKINSKSSKKVLQKNQEFINKQIRHHQKEFEMEPIQYLVFKLIRIFDKIMKKEMSQIQ